jgi:mono/diheme cytochrome c family protein
LIRGLKAPASGAMKHWQWAAEAPHCLVAANSHSPWAARALHSLAAAKRHWPLAAKASSRLAGAFRPRALLMIIFLAGCRGVQQPPIALPAELQAGEQLYRQYCQSCHGPEAVGTDLGPPLVDARYGPATTADAAILQAVQFGAKAKNWQLGDMPPTAGVTPADVAKIIPYVRYLQRTAANATATPQP